VVETYAYPGSRCREDSYAEDINSNGLHESLRALMSHREEPQYFHDCSDSLTDLCCDIDVISASVGDAEEDTQHHGNTGS
jgi:hypothetical protein